MWIDDQILKRCDEKIALSCWVPREKLVVLGNSQDPEKELNVDRCHESGIPILKRYGGGGAVVLYPGCLIISLGVWLKEYYKSGPYFCKINQAVIDALGDYDPAWKNLSQKGLSDICFGEKKVAGTSLFRSRSYGLYQASLIYDLNLEEITPYLKHPSREPDYRKSRDHGDFLTGLKSVSSVASSMQELVEHLKTYLPQKLFLTMGNDLINPQQDQIPHLLKRSHQSMDISGF